MARKRIGTQDGAAAIEFALIAPLLFMLVFGIIQFGIAFMQMQTLRGAVREGGRAAAVGAPLATIQSKTADASLGMITTPSSVQVSPAPASTSPCNTTNVGSTVTVSFNTSSLPGGGLKVQVPFLPTMNLHPTISAGFRCEV